jgi:hypothetical protein
VARITESTVERAECISCNVMINWVIIGVCGHGVVTYAMHRTLDKAWMVRSSQEHPANTSAGGGTTIAYTRSLSPDPRLNMTTESNCCQLFRHSCGL